MRPAASAVGVAVDQIAADDAVQRIVVVVAAVLQAQNGADSLRADVDDGVRVADFFQILAQQFPALSPGKVGIVPAVVVFKVFLGRGVERRRFELLLVQVDAVLEFVQFGALLFEGVLEHFDAPDQILLEVLLPLALALQKRDASLKFRAFDLPLRTLHLETRPFVLEKVENARDRILREGENKGGKGEVMVLFKNKYKQ